MRHELQLADGRGLVRLHWTAGRKRPAVAVLIDGTPVALETVDLASSTARERLVQQLPADLHDAVRAALVQLGLEPRPTPTRIDDDDADEPLVRAVEPWPELLDPATVVDLLVARIHRHLHLPEHADVVVAGWLVLTYCLDALPVAPILWVRSPTRGCGKSTLLDIVTMLAARTLKAENATLSALFRIAEQHRATLVLDELDQWLVGDRAGEIAGFLNAGFTRGARFLRSVGDHHEPKAFDVFGFRAVAGIGRTLHDTTRSRAYGIVLERAPSGAALAPLQVMHAERWAGPLRQQLARIGEQLREPLAIRLADPEATDLPAHLDGRARDLWLPLLALGAEIGGPFMALLAEACEVMTRRAAQEEGDIGVMLLVDIRRYFAEHDGRSVQPVQLLEWLHDQDGSPWSEYRAGRPLSARGLADLLKRFDIASTKPSRHDGTVGRWLHAAMFADAWARYCPDPDAGTDDGTRKLNMHQSGQALHPFQALNRNADPRNATTDRTDVTLPRTEAYCDDSPPSDPTDTDPPGLTSVDDGYFRSLFEDAA